MNNKLTNIGLLLTGIGFFSSVLYALWTEITDTDFVLKILITIGISGVVMLIGGLLKN